MNKGELFNIATQLNSYTHFPDEEKRELYERCYSNFQEIVNSIVKLPFTDIFDPYLNFTANRDNYSPLDALLIERELTIDLKKKLLEIKYTIQN